MKENTCCFFGHRKIDATEKMKSFLYRTIETLIVKENVDTFLFGSKSAFDDLCHQTVSELKRHYPFIKRVYVRAEFPYIRNDYHSYLLECYEKTYYPKRILNAGKACYVERNYEMINQSKFCIVYFDETCAQKSGTRIAYTYARKKERKILNLCIEKESQSF